jgi:putative flippase GtrA
MGVFLSHIGLEPIIYGLVIAFGLLVMWVKFAMKQWLSLVVDIVVFWLVFTLHGGTMTGGMAAAVAALVCGLIFPFILRRSFR